MGAELTNPLDSTAVQPDTQQAEQTDKPARKIKPSKQRNPETGLTGKQQAWANEYAKHGNGTEASLAVYDTTDLPTARSIAYVNLHSKPLLAYLRTIGQSEQVDPQSIIRVYRDAFSAEKTAIDKDGQPVTVGPDHSVRVKAADSAAKLLGLTGVSQSESVPSQHVHLHGRSLDDLVGRTDQPVRSAKQRGKSGEKREAGDAQDA